jgi:FtsP/CotA-like multicopper oxidase with cupredoxin domain
MQPFRACAMFAVLVGFLFVGSANSQNQAGADSPDWSKAQSLDVVMADFMFTPNALQFRANTPYRLRLVNKAGHGHSFDAPELFAAVRVADDDQSKVVKGEIEVEGGQTVDVKFVPQTPGAYKFHCSHFLHASFGMTGQAVIQ